MVPQEWGCLPGARVRRQTLSLSWAEWSLIPEIVQLLSLAPLSRARRYRLVPRGEHPSAGPAPRMDGQAAAVQPALIFSVPLFPEEAYSQDAGRGAGGSAHGITSGDIRPLPVPTSLWRGRGFPDTLRWNVLGAFPFSPGVFSFLLIRQGLGTESISN